MPLITSDAFEEMGLIRFQSKLPRRWFIPYEVPPDAFRKPDLDIVPHVVHYVKQAAGAELRVPPFDAVYCPIFTIPKREARYDSRLGEFF